MTPRQEIMLHRARALIADTRDMLDKVMDKTDPLTDKELSRIRESYDLICKANDKL